MKSSSTPIELPLTDTLRAHGVSCIIDQQSTISISFVNLQGTTTTATTTAFTFKNYGINNLPETIREFRQIASTKNVPINTQGDIVKYLSYYFVEKVKNYDTEREAEGEEEKSSSFTDEAEAKKKEMYIQKYSNGRLAESVIIAGHPCFLLADKNGNITIEDQLEFEDKILKPLEASMYLNKAYSFASREELDSYIDTAKKETVDSLYQRIKAIWK